MARILELSTDIERQHVAINGVEYEMATMEDFGIVDRRALTVAGKHLQVLDSEEELTEEQTAAIASSLDVVIGKILRGCPQEVIDTLSEGQKFRIAEVFTQAAGLTQPATPTGVSTSPASNGSTAARRKRG